jgi:hypothetical protein
MVWTMVRDLAPGNTTELPLSRVVFNILSLLAFFGLATAVFIAIRRGMGVHSATIIRDKGDQGIVDYNKVCDKRIEQLRECRHSLNE